jgi:hypothetical protein
VINFLNIAFPCESSWLTTARQISSVPVAISEVFHPTSHTAGTHAGISVDMKKSEMFATELFFFGNSFTACEMIHH